MHQRGSLASGAKQDWHARLQGTPPLLMPPVLWAGPQASDLTIAAWAHPSDSRTFVRNKNLLGAKRPQRVQGWQDPGFLVLHNRHPGQPRAYACQIHGAH